MAAGYTILTIDKGAKFEKILEITDANNTAIDLTGYTGTCSVKKSWYSTIDTFSITVTIQSPESAGQVKLSMTTAQTSVLVPGRYVFFVNLTIGGESERYLEGIIVVNPN